MTIQEFKLSAISKVDDGRIEEAWNQAVRRVVADLEDRPGVKDARKITLQAEFVPVLDPDGLSEETEVSFQVKDTVPTRKSKKISMQNRKGMLCFNDLSEDNVNQRTLDEGNTAFEEQ